MLMVEVLLNRPNTTKFYKVGKGHKLVSELRESSSNQVKVMLTVGNKITAFVVLNVKMFREKEDDEKSESFYYKEGFDRDVSLVSNGTQKMAGLSRFESFEEVTLPLKDDSQDEEPGRHKEEFDLSLDSARL